MNEISQPEGFNVIISINLTTCKFFRSSIGASFAKKRAIWYLTLGLGLLLTFAIVLWCTINSTNRVLWSIVYIRKYRKIDAFYLTCSIF